MPRGGIEWRNAGLLLLLGTLWGSTFSLSKLAVEGGIPPLGYAFWQSFCAGALLSAFARLSGARLPRDRRTWAFCFIAGLLGIAAPNITFYHVIAHVPAGAMAVVVTTAPLLTYLLALLLALERFLLLRGLGIFFGFCGALLLVLPRAPGEAGESEISGWLLLGFLTPLFYSLSNVFSAKFRPDGSNSLTLACGMLISASLLLLPAMLLFSGPYAPSIPPGVPEWALAGQVLVSSIAYVIFFHLVRTAGPVYFSQIAYIVTLSGICWGILFFGESLPVATYLAGLVIFGGLALVNFGQRSRRALMR